MSYLKQLFFKKKKCHISQNKKESMEKDFETLLHVFLCPQLDSNVAVSEFVHNVQEATSLNLHLFLQMSAAVDWQHNDPRWFYPPCCRRTRPLRFEVVGAENIQKACCHFNDNAWFSARSNWCKSGLFYKLNFPICFFYWVNLNLDASARGEVKAKKKTLEAFFFAFHSNLNFWRCPKRKKRIEIKKNKFFFSINGAPFLSRCCLLFDAIPFDPFF